ncbi:Di-copper centre-containing protein [Apiospora arundinis]
MGMEGLEGVERAMKRSNSGSCSLGTAQVRQDWENMSAPTRKSYVQAVQCLFNSKSKLIQYGWPTKSRYDDFVAVHVNMTTTVHNTGNFLSWHRYFLHAYETALRNECGYTGYMPYWNWFTHLDDVTKSPVFDGSATSLGSDGEFFYHNGSLAGVLQIPIPSGNGGGCIAQGPFAGQQVNIGPMLSVFEGFPTVKDLFVPNPHCIRRDLNSYVATRFFTAAALLNVTLGAASRSIRLFQREVQGGEYPGHLGLHATGHFVLGGDGTDLFSSPNDPAFFLHHAMLDRLWWIWQALHPALARTIEGTVTMNNNPPSVNATVRDELDVKGLLASKVLLQDVLDTMGGEPLCYVYN